VNAIVLTALLSLAPQGAIEAPKNAGTDVPPPAVLHQVDPVYPPEAAAAGISGIVIVELIIDEQGHVASAELVRSVPALDAAALAAVRQWRFAITRVDGHPVRVRHVVPLSFTRALPEDVAPDEGAAAQTQPAQPPVELISPPDEPEAAPPPLESGVSAVPDVELAQGVPDLLSGRRPVVPPLARIHGTSGTVSVRFTVNAAGKTTVNAVSGPDLLAPQAREAVARWVFRRRSPARLFLVATFVYEGDSASASVTPQD